MSEITEGIGTIVEGTLLGRAVEPDASGDGAVAQDGHTHERACLNCGTVLVGSHCHACGQKAHVHRTLSAFLHDLLHGALHFEGKIWHTLPLLIRRPGELTRRYIAGERAKFVSPMALFLFAVFLMFAVFQVSGAGYSGENTADPDVVVTGTPLEQGLEEARQEAQRDIDATQAKLDALAPGDPDRAALEQELQAQKAGREAITNPSAVNFGRSIGEGIKETGIPLIDAGVKKWRENPGLMLYKLQANSYKFSWLLIPLSLPFMWLLFAWRRQYRMYDHAVFVTYSLSFVTLLGVVLTIIDKLLPALNAYVVLAFLVLPVWHIRKQLRGAYAISRFGSIWRTIALLFFIAIILFLFLDVLLVLGVMG